MRYEATLAVNGVAYPLSVEAQPLVALGAASRARTDGQQGGL